MWYSLTSQSASYSSSIQWDILFLIWNHARYLNTPKYHGSMHLKASTFPVTMIVLFCFFFSHLPLFSKSAKSQILDWSRYSTSSETSWAVMGTAFGSPKNSLIAFYAKKRRFVQSVVISVLPRCNFRLPGMKKNKSIYNTRWCFLRQIDSSRISNTPVHVPHQDTKLQQSHFQWRSAFSALYSIYVQLLFNTRRNGCI